MNMDGPMPMLLEHWQDFTLLTANILALAALYWRMVVRITAVEKTTLAIKQSVEHIDNHKVDLGVCRMQHSGIESTLDAIQADIREMRSEIIELVKYLRRNGN